MQAALSFATYARLVEQQLGVPAMNWVIRITRRVAPWALGLVVFLLALSVPNETPVQAMTGPYAEGGNDFIVLFAASLAAGVTALLARKWLWPLLVVTVIGWVFFTMYPVLMVSSYYAAIRFTRPRHAIAYLSVAAAGIVIPAAAGGMMRDDSIDAVTLGVVGLGIWIGLPYVIGLWVSTRRQVEAGLRERAERLEQEQEARADQARAQERARIAREMHDVVAHRVALMVLHAGALEVNAPDERLANEAALIRNTGREALTELRQVLGVLRTPDAAESDLMPQPDLSDVERLLDLTRAAGQPVRFTEAGEPRPLPLMVQRAAYRVMQEALTNVVKHTGGADTSITLRYLHHAIEVVVENGPPPGPVEGLPGSGLGLIGLRERVALLYGRFEARARLDGGFRVSALLPGDTEEVPHDPGSAGRRRGAGALRAAHDS